MKKILFLFLLTFCSIFSVFAAIVKWDGDAGDGLWATAANWVGDVAPIAGDDVILDNSIVIGSYTVDLPSGNINVSIASLVINPTGANTIILTLPAANTSPTAFTANGPGDAVILNNGAVFINRSTAASGTPVSVTGTNFFRINNGGKYIHRSQTGHTTNLVARLSTAAGTENGIFEFDIPGSSTISLTGRNYGTLILSSAAFGAPLTYSGNGASALNIRGDFIINTGVTFSIGLSADMVVHGNYSQAASSTFNLQNSTNNNVVRLQGDVSIGGTVTETNTGLPTLEFNGSSNQNVWITGTIINSVTIRMNNSNGITLNTPVILPYILNLQNGKIKTDGTNILTLMDNATVTGGSSSSFVEGPMKKIGDDNFIFPVGKGNIYAPIGFTSTGMAVTDAFQAEYFRLNPQTAYGVNYQSPPIHHISYVEYWRLDKVSGNVNTPAKIILTVTENSFAKDFATLYVASYNTADMQWKSNDPDLRTPGPATPPYVTGTITSPALSPFGVFTIATSESVIINPLPVNLLSFNATRIINNQSKIEWVFADHFSGRLKFEVERSVNGAAFKAIQSFETTSSSLLYSVYDAGVSPGEIKYRLKITNEEGTVSYSNIVLLRERMKSFEVSFYPNPVINNGTMSIYSSVTRKINMEVYDASGKMIKQWEEDLPAGRCRLRLQTGGLSAGIYFIRLRGGEVKEFIHFIKR